MLYSESVTITSISLPKTISYDHAIKATNKMIEILNKIIRASNGKIVLCNNGKDIDETYKNNNVGVILHIEGAEAIDKNFKSLEKLSNIVLITLTFTFLNPHVYLDTIILICMCIV